MSLRQLEKKVDSLIADKQKLTSDLQVAKGVIKDLDATNAKMESYVTFVDEGFESLDQLKETISKSESILTRVSEICSGDLNAIEDIVDSHSKWKHESDLNALSAKFGLTSIAAEEALARFESVELAEEFLSLLSSETAHKDESTIALKYVEPRYKSYDSADKAKVREINDLIRRVS